MAPKMDRRSLIRFGMGSAAAALPAVLALPAVASEPTVPFQHEQYAMFISLLDAKTGRECATIRVVGGFVWIKHDDGEYEENDKIDVMTVNEFRRLLSREA